MTKETHIKGGYITSLLLLPYVYDKFMYKCNFSYRIILLLIYIYFSYLGSLFNDIDMKGSYISKRFTIIHKLFGKRFRHRGFTHSLLFLAIIVYFGEQVVVFTDNNLVIISMFSGFLSGLFSHICLDLITKEGVELLYPIQANFSLLPIKTSSRTEKNICRVLNVLIFILIGYRFYIITL